MQPVVSSTTDTGSILPKSGRPAAAPAAVRPASLPASGADAGVEVPSPEQIQQAIKAANEALKAVSSSLEFVQDPSTGKTVVRIIDAASQQVIRQFPSEEMLAIARAIDRLQGLLISRKA